MYWKRLRLELILMGRATFPILYQYFHSCGLIKMKQREVWLNFFGVKGFWLYITRSVATIPQGRPYDYHTFIIRFLRLHMYPIWWKWHNVERMCQERLSRSEKYALKWRDPPFFPKMSDSSIVNANMLREFSLRWRLSSLKYSHCQESHYIKY